jgi:hypothetical protein
MHIMGNMWWGKDKKSGDKQARFSKIFRQVFNTFFLKNHFLTKFHPYQNNDAKLVLFPNDFFFTIFFGEFLFF